MRNSKSRGRGTGKLALLLGAGAAAVALYKPVQSMWQQGSASLRETIRRLIEQQLSSRLGARVHFEQLRISLNGSMHAENLSILKDGSHEPFLTASRVRGQVSLAKALSGELSITTTTLEQPVISIVRQSDGRTNLPRAIPRNAQQATDQAKRLADTAEQMTHAAERMREMGLGLDIGKAVLLDGQVHFRDENLGGYHLSAEQIYGEMRRTMDGYDINGTIKSLGRRDEPVSIGPINVTARLLHVVNLLQADKGGLWANLDIGEGLITRLEIPSFAAGESRLNAEGSTDLHGLSRLLPENVPALRSFTQSGVEGEVSLSCHARFNPRDGLHIETFTIGARDVAVGGDKAEG